MVCCFFTKLRNYSSVKFLVFLPVICRSLLYLYRDEYPERRLQFAKALLQACDKVTSGFLLPAFRMQSKVDDLSSRVNSRPIPPPPGSLNMSKKCLYPKTPRLYSTRMVGSIFQPFGQAIYLVALPEPWLQ